MLRIFFLHRLVPLNTSNSLFGVDVNNKKRQFTETQDLRATNIAFILGHRGESDFVSAPSLIEDGDNNEATQNRSHNAAYQMGMMPGMAGTERFQQLCSMEYLNVYFKNILAGKTIKLYEPIAGEMAAMKAFSATGAVASYTAFRDFVKGKTNDPTFGTLEPGDTMLNMSDLTKRSGLPGSDAADAEENFQGIFARDTGPFLKGKGSKTALVDCTPGNTAATLASKMVQPYSMSRNSGDDLAFAVLDRSLTLKGLTDWRPDGIVLSKGVNDPSDTVSDQYIEARDGELYNIRVQGPAIATSWTGEKSLEVLTMDKVFVVIVADVWFDVQDNMTQSIDYTDTDGKPATKVVDMSKLLQDDLKTATDVSNYKAARDKYLSDPKKFDVDAFKLKQEAAFGGAEENTVLANFRVMVSTSSQMVNYSTFKPSGNKNIQADGKRRRLEGVSRMGLKLCNEVGEYIVGGWQIGNVLDTSASRAAMPNASNIGARTAPNSAALNVNVNISWYSADRLCRSFNNAEGSVRPRFLATDSAKEPVNMQANKVAFNEATGAAEA